MKKYKKTRDKKLKSYDVNLTKEQKWHFEYITSHTANKFKKDKSVSDELCNNYRKNKT